MSQKNSTAGISYESDQDKIIAGEKKFMAITGLNDVRGLAVSGGGIRSAAFGLGVMQALVGNKIEMIWHSSAELGIG
jgi:hypothetical protein